MEHKQSVPTDEGLKYDAGKLPYHLLPWDAIDEVVKVLEYGANKYGARNWEKSGHWHRNFSALMRHSTQWFMGQDLDHETGLSHLAHAICNLLFLLSFVKRRIGIDDRVRIHVTPLEMIKFSVEPFQTIEEAKQAAGELNGD